MKKKKGGKIILAAVAGVVLTVVVFYVQAANVEEVEAYRVNKGNIEEGVQIRGRVELEHKKKIYSELSAFVRNISVAEGSRVRADTKLAELEVDGLDTIIKKAGIDLKTSAEMVKNLESVSIPDLTKAFQLQQENYDRIRQSYESGSAALVELDAARMQQLESEMALKDAQHQLKIAKQNTEQAKLQLQDAGKNLEKISVVSTMDGVILNKFTEENCAVQPGTPLFEVGDTASAYVRVDVLASDAVKVKLGQKASITGEAAGNRPVEGEVSYIAPEAETKLSSLGVEQQRVEVRIHFDDVSLKQKPGYDVEVGIVTQNRNGLQIPLDSVFDSDGKDSVFVIKDDRLEIRNIMTGLENSRFIEVTDGLAEGDYVVANLKNSLKPGQKVNFLSEGMGK